MGILASVLLGLAAPPAGQVIGVSGAWAAIDRGTTCEALSRSPRAASVNRGEAVIGLAFGADRRRWGQFHARLGRPVRPGSTVLLDIGRQPFVLVSRATDAWSRNAAQDQAIVSALRSGGTIRVVARDTAGRRLTDYFHSDGAATAIDRAAARCAGKMR